MDKILAKILILPAVFFFVNSSAMARTVFVNDAKSLVDIFETGADKVFVEEGFYDVGKITIPAGVRLIGQGMEKTMLKGVITMEEDSVLENVGNLDGGIFVAVDADAEVKNVSIKNAVNNALETKGLGTLIARNVLIESPTKRGFYIPWGKHLVVDGLKIKGSGEEGMDIHSYVSGTIGNVEISGSGESGMEIIVGGTGLFLSDIEILQSKSSGITFQFYSAFPEAGKIVVTGARFSGNDGYGIECRRMEGKMNGNYWRNSLRFFGLDFKENGKKESSKNCGFEASSNKTIDIEREREYFLSTGFLNKARKAERRREVEEMANLELDRLEVELEDIRKTFESIVSESSNRNFLVSLFFGFSKEIARLDDIRSKNYKIGKASYVLIRKSSDGGNFARANQVNLEAIELAEELNETISRYRNHRSLQKLLANIVK